MGTSDTAEDRNPTGHKGRLGQYIGGKTGVSTIRETEEWLRAGAGNELSRHTEETQNRALQNLLPYYSK